MIRRNVAIKFYFPSNHVPLLVGVALALSSCATIKESLQSAGSYLGNQIGIVPDREVFTTEDQRHQATALITPEQEYHIGRAVAARLLDRFKQVKNDELQHYLALVGNGLVVSGDPAETFGGYHFIVVESDQINAMAAPGGYIFITSAFLRSLTSEDQLASVLAHEIAHVAHRHGVRILQQTAEFQELSQNTLTTGSLNCTEALIQATALFSRLVDSLVDTLLESGYSRELEFEADAYGMEVLLKTGYPRQAVFEALERVESADPSTRKKRRGWFSTHPSTDERITQLSQGGEGALTDDAADASLFAQRTARFRRAVRNL